MTVSLAFMEIQLRHLTVFTTDPPELEEYLAGSEDSDWAPCIIKNGYFDNHNLVNNKLIQN